MLLYGIIQTSGFTYIKKLTIFYLCFLTTYILSYLLIQKNKFHVDFKLIKLNSNKCIIILSIISITLIIIHFLYLGKFHAISLFLPVLIINKFYSEEYTGYYDLSRQILALPLALISTSVSQVLLQKIAEHKNKHNLVTLFIIKLSSILLGLSIFGGTIVYFNGPQLFSFVFGNEWEISGEITKILIFSYGIKFIVSPLSAIFISLERIKISSTWQIFYFGLICTLFLLEYINIEEFLSYYVIIDIFCYSIYYILIIITTKKYDRQLKND